MMFYRLPPHSRSLAYVVLTFSGHARGDGRRRNAICNVELRGETPSKSSKASERQE